MQLAFRVVNVFTQNRGRLTGNPLCVFEDGSGLDTVAMQALARQFNLSETTFVLPAADAAAQVRIFTPSYELAFAGHPTLGTAHVCRAMGKGGDSLVLVMPAGRISVSAAGDRWTLKAALATTRECNVERVALAEMLGVEPQDIGERPLWAKAGKEQLIVPLTSERAVRAVQPRPELRTRVVSEDGLAMVYVFAEVTPGRLLSRFFFPDGAAILEDPATGSATANLGAWLIAMGRTLPLRYEISQGERVARPSSLYLEVDAARNIFVAGDVVELARGTLQL